LLASAIGAPSGLEQAEPVHAGAKNAGDNHAGFVAFEEDDVRAGGEAIGGRGDASLRPAGDSGKLGEELKAAVKLVLVAGSRRAGPDCSRPGA
jgi:hypothetical protein